MSKLAHDPIQEQLIAARRNQILDAATTVFAEKGFERSTIKDIAKAAGIADGTIYIYFENKTALLLGLFQRVNESDQRPMHFEQADTMDMDTFFRTLLRHRLEMINGDGMRVIQIILSEMLIKPDLRSLYYEQVIRPTFALAENYFYQWIDKGLIRPFDVPLTMRLMTSMVLGLLVLRLLGDPTIEEQWQKLPDAIADMVLYGIQGDQT